MNAPGTAHGARPARIVSGPRTSTTTTSGKTRPKRPTRESKMVANCNRATPAIAVRKLQSRSGAPLSVARLRAVAIEEARGHDGHREERGRAGSFGTRATHAT